MSTDIKLSIIIPVKNEENNILNVINEIRNSLKNIKYEIIFVSDSSDKTNIIIKKEQSSYIALSTPNCNDLAQSVASGIKLAKGKYIAVMDGDGSHPALTLNKMLKKAKPQTLVVAARNFRSLYSIQWSFGRKMLSYIGKALSHPLLPIEDPMSGFFLFPKNMIKNTNLHTKGYKILLEIATKGKFKDIKQVKYRFRMRNKGKSKIGAKTVLYFLISLPYLYMYKWIKK